MPPSLPCLSQTLPHYTFSILSLILLSIGYIWLWCFNRNLHVLIKFLSLKSYLLTWIYFLILTLKKTSIFTYRIDRLFQLSFVLQLVVCPAYWLLVHNAMADSGRFPRYQVNWNIYVHVIPIILLLVQLIVYKRGIIGNNWRDTAKFYYFIALPINILYSHLHHPVYKFLQYKTIIDYVAVLLVGLILIIIHHVCYWVCRDLRQGRILGFKVGRKRKYRDQIRELYQKQ